MMKHNIPTSPYTPYTPYTHLHPPTIKNKKKHKNMKSNYKLNIAAALKQRNMTNRDLAQRLNVKDSSVTSFIKGNPTINTLYDIAEALDCEVIDLFFPTEEAPALFSEEEDPTFAPTLEDEAPIFTPSPSDAQPPFSAISSPSHTPTPDLQPPTSPTPTSSSPSNEPPLSAIPSPSHTPTPNNTPTLAISCPHCHRPIFLSFRATPTLE